MIQFCQIFFCIELLSDGNELGQFHSKNLFKLSILFAPKDEMVEKFEVIAMDGVG